MDYDIPLIDDDDFISRPRVNSQIETALKRRFVSVIGGPGTGKTMAVADTLRALDSSVMWYSATRLDEMPENIWREFAHHIGMILPEAKSAFDAIPFSHDFQFMYNFLSVWRQHFESLPTMIWVIDNFHFIKQKLSPRFLLHMWEARPKNLQIIVISEATSDRDLSGLIRENDLNCITGADLAFTPAEVEALLSDKAMGYTRNKLNWLMRTTGGWPYAINEYIRQQQNKANRSSAYSAFNTMPCYKLLNNEWYSTYAADMQKILLQLAQLPAFTCEIVQLLSGFGPKDMLFQIMEDSFILHDASSETLMRFQPMCHQFLLFCAKISGAKRQKKLYRQAGDQFAKEGHITEAIECYGKGKHYEDLINLLKVHGGPRAKKSIANTVKPYLEEMPDSVRDEYPMVRVLTANMKLGVREFFEAKEILYALKRKYESKSRSKKRDQILGETYLAIANLHYLQTRLDIGKYLKKADILLPNGSLFYPKNEYPAANESMIQLTYCNADTLDRVEEELSTFERYAPKLYHMVPYGMPAAFSAESALVQYDVEKAEKAFVKATEAVSRNDDHETVIHMMISRTRFAIMTGDLKWVSLSFVKLDEYIEQRDLVYLRPVCLYLKAWLYIKTDLLDQVPDFIKSPYVYSEMPETTHSSYEMIVHIDYSIATGDYKMATLMINQAEEYARHMDLWYSQIALHLRRAVCQHFLEEHDEMIRSFERAYDMAYPARLDGPFIEYGKYMRTLIYSLEKEEELRIDREWLLTILTKAKSYAKRVSTIRQMLSDVSEEVDAIYLTPKEKNVLQLLYSGQTRKEISKNLAITVNGVQRHITSLYNKLDANNRADVIRNAVSQGLLNPNPGTP